MRERKETRSETDWPMDDKHLDDGNIVADHSAFRAEAEAPSSQFSRYLLTVNLFHMLLWLYKIALATGSILGTVWTHADEDVT